jgi:hypothetical protein
MKAVMALLLLAMAVNAQSFDPQTAARAGVHDLKQHDVSVLGWNPSLLSPDNGLNTSIELPSIGITMGNNAFSVSYWNRHFGKDGFLDNATKADVLSHIPGGGLEGQAQISAPIVGFSRGRMGARLAVESSNRVTLPRDLAVLALDGNEAYRTYSFHDSRSESETMLDWGLGFSYAFEQEEIPELAVGCAFHFYQGLYLAKIAEANGEITAGDSLSGWMAVHSIRAEKGDGVGFDIGATATLTGNLQVGLAVRQLSTRISWIVNRNDLVSAYRDSTGVGIGSLEQGDSLERDLHYRDTSYAGGVTDTKLPTLLEANVHYQWNAKWALMGNVLYRASTTIRGPAGLEVGAATEYKVRRFLVLQGGASVGGPWSWRVGAGGGLRFGRYEVDIGGNWNDGLFNGARGFGWGIAQRLRF